MYNFGTFWRSVIHRRIKKKSFEYVDSWPKTCLLGPTIFKIQKPNWYYCSVMCILIGWKFGKLVLRVVPTQYPRYLSSSRDGPANRVRILHCRLFHLRIERIPLDLRKWSLNTFLALGQYKISAPHWLQNGQFLAFDKLKWKLSNFQLMPF